MKPKPNVKPDANAKPSPSAKPDVSSGLSQTVSTPVYPTFKEAKMFNEWERGIALPTFPSVSLGQYNLSPQIVSKLFRAGIERIVSATTAPIKGDKHSAILGVLALLEAGYLTESEKEKATKAVVGKSTSSKGSLFAQADLVRALNTLGYDKAATTVSGLSQEKFVLVYGQQLGVESSRIYAAHTWLIAERDQKAAEAASAALADVPLEDL